jgi:glycosyltransferase involved in cell wall biosynthesis
VSPDRVVALVPAHDEGDRVGATVRSLATMRGVSEVIVVDDGSLDATAAVALAAGATVLRIPNRIGKGGALEGALRRLPPADVWLLADADLGDSAGCLAPVLAAVAEDRVDLAIALLPPQAGGGLGSVRRFAARAIALLSGFEALQPLSGQRAVRGGALARCRPLAGGFGVETAMTIDAVRAGLRVREVPAPGLAHRPTGRDIAGFGHRGRQGLDILRAVGVRAVRRRRRP